MLQATTQLLLVEGTSADCLISHFLFLCILVLCVLIGISRALDPRSGLVYKLMHSGSDVITMQPFGEHLASPNDCVSTQVSLSHLNTDVQHSIQNLYVITMYSTRKDDVHLDIRKHVLLHL